MIDQELLLEGGAAGHMDHLYDNPDLTFAKIKEIFTAAANGNLEGAEKTDGQNVMISYSIHDGRIKGVRNKTEIKAGGLSPEKMAEKFASHANKDLKDVFSDSLRALERAIQTLSIEEQEKIFGLDTNNFYSVEIMDPRTRNVINYDAKALVIHRTGTLHYDRKTEKITPAAFPEEAEKMIKRLSDVQQDLTQSKYSIQIDAIKKLKELSDKRPLNIALNGINKLLSNINSLIKSDTLKLTDESTIADFMTARVYILINSILQKGKINSFDPVAKMNIAKRILGIKGISVKDISAKVSKEQLEFVKEHFLNDQSRREILKTAIMPLELIVSDFSIEMLKGLQSAFIVDNAKEVQRLRKELQTAINSIQSSNNEEALKIVKLQMKKLKSVEKIETAAEGFVFDYDGKTYKFTGGFAPLNQILGLFKYGRGNIKPVQKLEEAKSYRDTIALLPGAFKPPHRAHFAMVEKCLKKAEKVIIFISPLARQASTGLQITADMAEKIWRLYLKKAKIEDKVIIKQSSVNSPVQIVYDFIENKENDEFFAQNGQTVFLVAGTQEDDIKRFSNLDQKRLAKRKINVQVLPVKSPPYISATKLREAIANKNINSMKRLLPDLGKKSELAEEILKIVYNKQKLEENIIYDIINEQVLKVKYSLLKKENMAAGAIQGALKPTKVEQK